MCTELARARRRGAGFGPSWNVLWSHGWNEIFCIFFGLPTPAASPAAFAFIFFLFFLDSRCGGMPRRGNEGSAADAEEIHLHERRVRK